MDDRIRRANLGYERLVFTGDSDGVAGADAELDGVEADLCMARGRLGHGRSFATGEEDPLEMALFERAAELYRRHADMRGEAEAVCWIGILHQVIRHDDAAAVPALERARELAVAAGDPVTLSYALRHLGVAEHAAGHLEAAKDLLGESTRLRRRAGHAAGAAANLVGLIYIAAAQGRHADAADLAGQARALAESAGAHAILRQIAEAGAVLR